jgi:hypothetical protein
MTEGNTPWSRRPVPASRRGFPGRRRGTARSARHADRVVAPRQPLAAPVAVRAPRPRADDRPRRVAEHVALEDDLFLAEKVTAVRGDD